MKKVIFLLLSITLFFACQEQTVSLKQVDKGIMMQSLVPITGTLKPVWITRLDSLQSGKEMTYPFSDTGRVVIIKVKMLRSSETSTPAKVTTEMLVQVIAEDITKSKIYLEEVAVAQRIAALKMQIGIDTANLKLALSNITKYKK